MESEVECRNKWRRFGRPCTSRIFESRDRCGYETVRSDSYRKLRFTMVMSAKFRSTTNWITRPGAAMRRPSNLQCRQSAFSCMPHSITWSYSVTPLLLRRRRGEITKESMAIYVYICGVPCMIANSVNALEERSLWPDLSARMAVTPV